MLRLAGLLALLLVCPGASAIGEPAFAVELDATERKSPPQRVAMFTATLTSRASEPVRIVFEIVERTGGAQPATPVPIELAPEGDPRSVVRVPLGLQTPFWNGRVDDVSRVTYRLTATDPATNATLGEPQDITVTVHTAGNYAPGPQFFGVFLALALAALVLRRRG